MQVHFLMRVFAVIVTRHIARDHHHGDAIERRIGHARRRIGQTGREMRQQHRGPPRNTRITIGGMGADLFMADIDEAQAGIGQRREHGDIRVAAQPENMAHTARFEIAHQLRGHQVSLAGAKCTIHHITSVL